MKYVMILGLGMVFWACNTQDDRSFAYGSFESAERIISAEQPGKMLKLYVAEGQIVKKGEQLALQDTLQVWLMAERTRAMMETVRSKLRTADADVAVLLERRDHLKREVARVGRLVEAEALPQRNLDELETELGVVMRQIEAIRSNMGVNNRAILSELGPLEVQLAQYEDQLQRARLISPINGIVVQIYTEEGEVAMAGKPVVKVADNTHMEFRMYLTASQLGQLKIGDTLLVTQAGIDKSYNGILSWVSTEAEFTPKNIQTTDQQANLVYAAKVRVQSDGFLKSGMPGEVTLTLPEKND